MTRMLFEGMQFAKSNSFLCSVTTQVVSFSIPATPRPTVASLTTGERGTEAIYGV